MAIRSAIPGAPGSAPGSGGGDVKFLDHLQKKYSNQVGFLPLQALEWNIEHGNVSIALENDEPAAYLLGKGTYLRDPHFGIIYQAAVSYDARRRLMGTALVQHFIDHMAPNVRLIGLWCAQDIEANEFWNACGFEAIAARHGSRRKGRVHIFWVGRTHRGKDEPMRYPKQTHGGLMKEYREVYGLAPGMSGDEYKDVVLPELEAADARPRPRPLSRRERGAKQQRGPKASLAEMQRAYRYGQSNHICVVVAGVTKYLPVAPFELPNFTDLARAMVPRNGSARSKGAASGAAVKRIIVPSGNAGGLWTPARTHDAPDAKAATG